MWEVISKAAFYIFCMAGLLIVTVSSFVGIGYIGSLITGLPMFLAAIIFNAIFYLAIFIAFIIEIQNS